LFLLICVTQGPALDWAARHREELNARDASSIYYELRSPKFIYVNLDSSNDSEDSKVPRMVATRKSSLEMKLHRVNFVELLRRCGTEVDVSQGRLEAVKYARANFANIIEGHEQEVSFLAFNCLC
jgi:hypothetical protein